VLLKLIHKKETDFSVSFCFCLFFPAKMQDFLKINSTFLQKMQECLHITKKFCKISKLTCIFIGDVLQ